MCVGGSRSTPALVVKTTSCRFLIPSGDKKAGGKLQEVEGQSYGCGGHCRRGGVGGGAGGSDSKAVTAGVGRSIFQDLKKNDAACATSRDGNKPGGPLLLLLARGPSGGRWLTLWWGPPLAKNTKTTKNIDFNASKLLQYRRTDSLSQTVTWFLGPGILEHLVLLCDSQTHRTVSVSAMGIYQLNKATR